MDFSKVRSADFNQARLRDVLAGEEPQNADISSISEFSNGSANYDDASMTEDTSFGGCDPASGRVLSHAPQYFATSLASLNVKEEVRELDVDPYTGYCLAVTDNGLRLWKQQADNRVFFRLPENHDMSARFMNNAHANTRSMQPHFVSVNRKSGLISYFDSISRVVINPTIDQKPKDSSEMGDHRGLVHSGLGERIEHIEIVGDSGLVVATNNGNFYWINLRDDLGKINIQATPMRHGSGVFARLRSLGPFARDVVSIKVGRLSNPSETNGMEYELYVINRAGDIALWHIGRDGINGLISEVRIGSKLTAQMDQSYPNSGFTSSVHDLALESQSTHISASFAPDSRSQERVFVVSSLNLESDVVSVRRLQTYSNELGTIDEDITRLHANDEGVLTVVTSDAFIMVDSPSKFNYSGGLPLPRWEECLYSKDSVRVLTSKLSRTSSIIIASTWDLIDSKVTGTQNAEEGAVPEESTTKVRLEQAVFESSPTNPLNSLRWSDYEAHPDPNAVSQLALEIANADSPFVPKDLPNMSVHLDLRLTKSLDLYTIQPLEPIREVSQALVAAVVLNKHVSDANSTTASQLLKVVDSAVAKLKPNHELREVLTHDVLVVPTLLTDIASSTSAGSVSASSNNNKSSQKNTAAALSNEVSYILLEILQVCDSNDLGIPLWATAGPLKQSFEYLTSKASDSDNVESLATVTDSLCSLYSVTKSADSAVVRNLLFKLAQLGSPEATRIAAKHSIYSASAPLEVDQWSQTNDPNTVLAHIEHMGPKYSDYVFETCVTTEHVSELVEILAKVYPDQVESYLTKHNLDKIAWTLAPQSKNSTQHLSAATDKAENTHDRRLYASSYKISSYFTGGGDFAKAQLTLDLINIQDSLMKQFQTAPASVTKSDNASSPLVRHGLSLITSQHFSDKNTAVDMCALAPPQAIPETNENFIIGFKLVDEDDVVRRRSLVQQLIINSNWERVSSAANTALSTASQAYLHKSRQTLFNHTLQNVNSLTSSLLRNFKEELAAPKQDEVRRTWTWATDDSVYQELEDIALRAQSIAEKYDVSKSLEPSFEDTMDM